MNGELSATIVVLAYKRSDTLREVLRALSASLIPEYKEIIFVQQGNHVEVTSVIEEFTSLPSKHFHFDRRNVSSPEEAINANVFAGISTAFSKGNTDIVTVLEDDIFVGEDFLRFNFEMCKKYYLDSEFRGVNGFSGIPRSPQNQFTYSKQRYGLGWGWSISRENWKNLRKNWTGTENFHWDGLVEAYCKTGFVVMPSQSRILNLGFGKEATHTNDPQESREIQKKLHASFVSNQSGDSKFFNLSEFQNWRSDCLPYFNTITLIGKTLNVIYQINFLIRIKPGDSILIKKVKSKGMSLIHRLILVLLQPSSRAN